MSNLFELSKDRNSVIKTEKKMMREIGLNEPNDLENWIFQIGVSGFERDILWINRQDYATYDQRSDLIGIDKDGNQIICELKCGVVSKGSVSQVLSYAAEYSVLSEDEMIERYISSATKYVKLFPEIKNKDDATQSIRRHVHENTDINSAQIMMLVGEKFDPSTISICDYINTNSNESTFSFECWEYSIHKRVHSEEIFMLLNQIIPARSAREIVEERRESAKTKNKSRNPEKKIFINEFIEFMQDKDEYFCSKGLGVSYQCKIYTQEQGQENPFYLSVHDGFPRLFLPHGGSIDKSPNDTEIDAIFDEHNKTWTVLFNKINDKPLLFSHSVGEIILRVINSTQSTEGNEKQNL